MQPFFGQRGGRGDILHFFENISNVPDFLDALI